MSFKSWFIRKILRNKEAKWNHKFSTGRWEGLKELAEVPRFSVIAGFLPFLKPGGHDVLEYGCADGLLFSRMHREQVNYYEGVDVSSYIIQSAQETYGSGSVKFVSADMDTYQPSQPFDFIIFNEVLCYSKDYKALLQHTANFLKDDGLIISSLNGLIKDREDYNVYIAAAFNVLEKTTVVTSRTSFDINVFERR
jgi:2-polyprenyl-3-methyl-5-hydroxy-6-metoxy-1,4-benzoquinol methylase